MEEPLVRCQLLDRKIQIGFGPLLEGFHYAIYNDLESVKQLVTENTAAVMLELVQGEGGVIPADKDFVAELARYCKEQGLLLIVDEVQTGIGRTGTLLHISNMVFRQISLPWPKAWPMVYPLEPCLESQL